MLPNGLSDEELMRKYQEDDFIAFEELYQRYKKKIYSYVNSKVFDKSMVDEVFQNVFLKLHKSRHLYDDKFPFKYWIFTLSKNIIIDYFRTNKKSHLNETLFDSTLAQVEEEDHSDKKEIDLAILKDRERQAIELRYEQEKDFAEIARILDTNQTNVRKIISRALDKLKKKLSNEVV